MTHSLQLEFDFMTDDINVVLLRRLEERALSSIDYPEYEFHRRRIDGLI